jgi:hypothetical protein
MIESIVYIKSLLQEAKTNRDVLNKIKIKLQEFKNQLDTAENQSFDTKSKDLIQIHKKDYKDLKNEYDWNVKINTKEQLFTDHIPTTNNDAMTYSLDIMHDSEKSLIRTLKLVENTKIIGEQVVQKLHMNTEQIEGMYDKLESIETTLSRSMKIVRRIFRKIATDKVIWVVTFLVIVAVIYIIVKKSI